MKPSSLYIYKNTQCVSCFQLLLQFRRVHAFLWQWQLSINIKSHYSYNIEVKSFKKVKAFSPTFAKKPTKKQLQMTNQLKSILIP